MKKGPTIEKKIIKRSILLNSVEGLRVLHRLHDSVPVLDMPGVVLDSGVKDMRQRMLSQIQHRHYPKNLRKDITLLKPHFFQVRHRVYVPLVVLYYLNLNKIYF